MNGADNDGGASAKPLAASTTTTTATATTSSPQSQPPSSTNLSSDRRSLGNNNNTKMVATIGDGEMGETTPCSSGNRRPQIQITPISQVTTPNTPNPASPKNLLYLTLTVRKDENGYGMKVGKPRSRTYTLQSLEENLLIKINI